MPNASQTAATPRTSQRVSQNVMPQTVARERAIATKTDEHGTHGTMHDMTLLARFLTSRAAKLKEGSAKPPRPAGGLATRRPPPLPQSRREISPHRGGAGVGTSQEVHTYAHTHRHQHDSNAQPPPRASRLSRTSAAHRARHVVRPSSKSTQLPPSSIICTSSSRSSSS